MLQVRESIGWNRHWLPLFFPSWTCGRIATANNGDLDGREVVQDSATWVSSSLQILTQSLLSAPCLNPYASQIPVEQQQRPRTQESMQFLQGLGPTEASILGALNRTRNVTITTLLATPLRDDSSKPYIWYFGCSVEIFLQWDRSGKLRSTESSSQHAECGTV